MKIAIYLTYIDLKFIGRFLVYLCFFWKIQDFLIVSGMMSKENKGVTINKKMEV